MRKPEQRLWDRMRRNLAPFIFMRRIENRLEAGTPDVICPRCVVELKAVEEPPKRETTPLLGDDIGLSADQKNFIRDWIANRGSAFVIVGVGKGATAQQYILDGSLCELINQLPLSELKTRSLANDWRGIGDILDGRTA